MLVRGERSCLCISLTDMLLVDKKQASAKYRERYNALGYLLRLIASARRDAARAPARDQSPPHRWMVLWDMDRTEAPPDLRGLINDYRSPDDLFRSLGSVKKVQDRTRSVVLCPGERSFRATLPDRSEPVHGIAQGFHHGPGLQ